MSNINELIQQYCPDGVEYRPLEQCCNILDNLRKPITKALRVAGNYPYYGANGIQDYVEGYIFDGTFVLVGEDGSVQTANGRPVVTWAEGKIWVNNHAHIISEITDVNLRYIFHYLQTINIAHLIHGNIPKLTGGDFKALEIPVPPLPVQEEVVRILDKFTELEQELEQELELRKKQYEYYRDKILSLSDYDGEVEWKSLDEIATNWFRGNGIKRDEVIEDGKPCIRYGELYTTYGLHFTDCVSHTSVDVLSNPKIAKKGAILFAITGENVEDIAMSTAYLGEEDIYVGGDILVMEHEQDAKYLSYVLSTTDARKQKSKGRIKSKVVHSNKNDISQIIIPVPKDTNEQRRVADVLDRFYNLINNISEGLPVEIKMRHQQYEYYRDKLLNFKRLEVV